MRLPFFRLCSGSPPFPHATRCAGLVRGPILKDAVRKPVQNKTNPNPRQSARHSALSGFSCIRIHNMEAHERCGAPCGRRPLERFFRPRIASSAVGRGWYAAHRCASLFLATAFETVCFWPRLFGALEAAQRQYDLRCEIADYLKTHPKSAVVNLGCGLDDSFSKADNSQCKGYNLDLPDVIPSPCSTSSARPGSGKTCGIRKPSAFSAPLLAF